MRALKVCLLILSLLLVVVEVCYGGDLNLQLIATMTGENEGDWFGRTVAGLGDVNNDGYDDVAVNGAGKVYIFFGFSGFDSVVDVILDDGVAHSNFGFSIACAGDVNGDSISDFMIGACGYNSDSGRVYLGREKGHFL